ncbi:MAG: hypothetical protein KA762_14405 [Ferruginibacter sp.]|nr:hypothetical protein [Ferruginibacter sp.]
MKYILLLLLLPVLFSCTNPTGIKEIITGADSVAINYFKGDGTADTVVNMAMLKDKSQINKLAGYVEAAKAEQYKCGYDGSIHIFKRDVVLQDINFSFNDVQCMHFSFLLKNQLYSTKLSAEALQFIKSVNKK